MKKRLGLDQVIPENVVGVKYISAPRVEQFKPNDRLSNELLRCGKHFSKFGWAPEYEIKGTNRKGSSGNLGFRDGKSIVVTASGTDLGKLVSEDMIPVFEVDYTTTPPTVYYQTSVDRKPTSEFLAYDAILKKRPDVSVILHGHNKLTTEYAQYLAHYYPDLVARTDENKPYGTVEFANSVAEKLTFKKKYVVANGHGFFSLGENFSEAFLYALLMHANARLLKVYSGVLNKNIVASPVNLLHLDGFVAACSDILAEPVIEGATSIGGRVLEGINSIRSKIGRKIA